MLSCLPGTTTATLPIRDYVSDFDPSEIALELLDQERFSIDDKVFDGNSADGESLEQMDFVHRFKTVLRPKQWMVFSCYYFGNYTQMAIANMFGISQPVVSEILKSSEARIRRKLGPLIEGFFEYKNKRGSASA